MPGGREAGTRLNLRRYGSDFARAGETLSHKAPHTNAPGHRPRNPPASWLGSHARTSRIRQGRPFPAPSPYRGWASRRPLCMRASFPSSITRYANSCDLGPTRTPTRLAKAAKQRIFNQLVILSLRQFIPAGFIEEAITTEICSARTYMTSFTLKTSIRWRAANS